MWLQRQEYVRRGMLMVVFGAGASHDSLAEYPPQTFGTFQQLTEPHFTNEPKRPPLAIQLFQHERFSRFFAKYPECVGLFPQLDRAARSTGLEQRLAELVEESAEDSVIREQMVALRFYLKDVIGTTATQWLEVTRGADNYADLLNRIDYWRRRTDPRQQVALVTFNYDVLLDQAVVKMPHARGGLVSMNDYVSRDEYKLIKLHGSTDWLRQIERPNRSGNSYTEAVAHARDHGLQTEDDKIVTANEAAATGNRLVEVPAIAIPVQEKSTFEAPQSHLEMLAKCIDATTDLIVVGWKGMETHFLDLWHAKVPPEYPQMGPPHLKRVLIVDKGEGAQVVEGQLRNIGLFDQGISIESLTDGFSGFLRGDRLKTFLSGVLLMPDRARV